MRFEHPSNGYHQFDQYVSTSVRLLGRFIFSILVHFANALFPIDFKFFERFTFSKFAQSVKLSTPIDVTVSDILTSCKFVQSAKLLSPIDVTVSGILTFSNPVFPNIPVGICVIPSSNSISLRFEHPSNGYHQFMPYVSTSIRLLGRFIFPILVHLTNALFPILIKFFGKLTFSKFEQSLNADALIDVIESGICAETISWCFLNTPFPNFTTLCPSISSGITNADTFPVYPVIVAFPSSSNE